MGLRAHKVLFEEDGEVEDGEAILVGVRLRKRCGESRLKTAVHIFTGQFIPDSRKCGLPCRLNLACATCACKMAVDNK